MALISYFSSDILSAVLRRSNYWAKQNRNAYPLKIHNAISALYEWIDCPCDSNCDCKKYACKKHLTRKADISFDTYHDYFLDCYVDSKLHDALRQNKTSGRGYRAVEATEKIGSRWNEISKVSSKKHLICSDWCDPLYQSLATDFRAAPDTIYHAKMAITTLL